MPMEQGTPRLHHLDYLFCFLRSLLEEAHIYTHEALRKRFYCTYNSGRQSRDIFACRCRRCFFVCRFSIFLALGSVSCPAPSH
ncbi:hypothetical protein K1719_025397 [Acacia pycnantha]|nr:hypothetical protein K1719_025397 [Acacia pycnantha]